MPSCISLHPGHPLVKPSASKSDCFRYTLFNGPAQKVDWEKGLRQVRGCDRADLPWPNWYVDDLLRVGPSFWHKFPSDCPSNGRFTIRHQDVLTGLHRKPTNIAGSIPFFARSVNGPTRHHTLSPNTHLPMWCPRTRHRSNGIFPYGPTVSRFSKVVACTIIKTMVFDSGGICIWQLNSSSFLSFLTMPPTSPTAFSAGPFPA